MCGTDKQAIAYVHVQKNVWRTRQWSAVGSETVVYRDGIGSSREVTTRVAPVTASPASREAGPAAGSVRSSHSGGGSPCSSSWKTGFTQLRSRGTGSVRPSSSGHWLRWTAVLGVQTPIGRRALPGFSQLVSCSAKVTVQFAGSATASPATVHGWPPSSAIG